MWESLSRIQKFIVLLVLVVAIIAGLLLAKMSKREALVTPRTIPAFTNPSVGSLQGQKPLERVPAVTETDTIRMKGRAFEPSVARVKVGAFVTWANYDFLPHTVTGSSFHSGTLSEGSTWSQHFTKPGRYEYGCSIHPNMRGVVEVR